MKTGVPAAMMQALSSGTACPVIFVDCQFTTPIRRANLDVDYYLGGDKYEAGGVTVGDIASGTGSPVSRMQLVLANVDRQLSAILLSNNEQGKPVIVHLGIIDLGEPAGPDMEAPGSGPGGLIASVELFRGELSFYEIQDDVVTLHIVNELIRWRRKTSRRAQSSCPWPFGGIECTYAGDETWCDQTHDRCAALGNTDNFGGNRFLPEFQEKRIWWGRLQA